MHFREYQIKTDETDTSKTCTNPNFLYYLLGVCGETGELTEKIKKIIREKNGIVSNEDKEALKFELGDILWYVARLADALNLDLDKVAQANLDKLLSRKNRNKLYGNGDNR